MRPQISVIVPIYNVAPYISRCVESLLAQTFSDFELILVDDGSTDGCGAICDEFAGYDGRVVVLHRPNGGQAEARNTGLAHCRGDYIAYVDGDDSVAPDYLSTLYCDLTLTNADIAVCERIEVYEGKAFSRPSSRADVTVMSGQQALSALLYQKEFDCALWAKLYKTSLFGNISFPKGKPFEDFAVNYQLFDRADRVCYRPYAAYYYLQRAQGMMLSPFTRSKLYLLDAADEMYVFVKERYPHLESAALSRLVRANLQILLQLPREQRYEPDRQRISRTIKKYRARVIWDRQARLGTKSAMLLSFAGTDILQDLKPLRRLGKI